MINKGSFELGTEYSSFCKETISGRNSSYIYNYNETQMEAETHCSIISDIMLPPDCIYVNIKLMLLALVFISRDTQTTGKNSSPTDCHKA
jgi:hypothetical protein